MDGLTLRRTAFAAPGSRLTAQEVFLMFHAYHARKKIVLASLLCSALAAIACSRPRRGR
jgi:hypothetical protein